VTDYRLHDRSWIVGNGSRLLPFVTTSPTWLRCSIQSPIQKALGSLSTSIFSVQELTAQLHLLMRSRIYTSVFRHIYLFIVVSFLSFVFFSVLCFCLPIFYSYPCYDTYKDIINSAEYYHDRNHPPPPHYHQLLYFLKLSWNRRMACPDYELRVISESKNPLDIW
jgi:hypothetical protein